MKRNVLRLARQIPLDTLGRLVEAAESGQAPHPLLLSCSDSHQYEALAILVELLAGVPTETRAQILQETYNYIKLTHTREKL